VGLWEYDPSSGSIAWLPFTAPDKALRERLSQTEAYIRDQLGDARYLVWIAPKAGSRGSMQSERRDTPVELLRPLLGGTY
jgi:hypothetical protein